MRIDGRHALVTGATGGLGEAIARGLHARGARLTLTGRRADALEALAGQLGATALPADIADRAQLERLLASVDPVDILIANAALPASGPLEEYSEQQLDRALDVNLRAPVIMARRLAPGMVDRGRGQLVFVASVSGIVTAPRSALYSATKFGLRGFALALRQDLHGSGVGVSVISPGFIRDAGMFADTGMRLPVGVGTKRPRDVAKAVVNAIERDRAEIVVAPALVRVGATLGAVAPALAAAGNRLLGATRVASGIAERQRVKR